jgi:hypothetical protein
VRPAPIGDPIRGEPHYSLCIYPGDADRPAVASAALPWPECGEPPCWTGDVEHGFVLRGDSKLLRNLETLVLPGKEEKTPVLYARGAVPRKGLRPFALDRPVTVQLILNAGGRPASCWSSTPQPAKGLDRCEAPASYGASAAPRANVRSE